MFHVFGDEGRQDGGGLMLCMGGDDASSIAGADGVERHRGVSRANVRQEQPRDGRGVVPMHISFEEIRTIEP